MNDIAIKVEGLGKAYRLGTKNEDTDTLVSAAINLIKTPFRNFQKLRNLNTFIRNQEGEDIFWALKNVSFEIPHGEVVGFIGRNGAGKSTLLKVLSRITEPTEGRVEIRGRISSLLEVGTGFHPELTGRENIYMNATILGMKKVEIERKFDEIVDFSGVERFLDTPVKRYSSGMKVRLAFSVAAHLEPEILIVDEVLAVGDAEFQKKCLNKMQDVAGGGRTVLFVSHNMGAIKNLCSRVLSLKQGQIATDGPSDEVVQTYLSSLFDKDNASGFEPGNPLRETTGGFHVKDGRILNSMNQPSTLLVSGEPVTFEFEYKNPDNHKVLDPKVIIADSHGNLIFYLHPKSYGLEVKADFEGTLRCTLPKLALPLGEYRVNLLIFIDGSKVDHIPNALFFTVTDSTFFPFGFTPEARFGCALSEQIWEV